MLTRRKLKAKIVEMTYRIEELEERLCPCQSHQWKYIEFDLNGGSGLGDEIVIYQYQCKQCGKRIRSIYPGLERRENES